MSKHNIETKVSLYQRFFREKDFNINAEVWDLILGADDVNGVYKYIKKQLNYLKVISPIEYRYQRIRFNELFKNIIRKRKSVRIKATFISVIVILVLVVVTLSITNFI